MADAPVVLITGVSSGLGKVTAEAFVAAGFRVFGTRRSASAEMPANVTPLQLDVRDDASVKKAVSDLLAQAGRIDILVNNAGGSVVGAIEETSPEQVQGLFDANVFGALRLTQAVLPTMRKQGSGRIIFISSIVGFMPSPYMGVYTATKHAVEGLAESLDHEIRPFGVRAILVEPGFMKTAIGAHSPKSDRPIDAYATTREYMYQWVNKKVAEGDNPADIAAAVVAAAKAKKPRIRYPVGKGSATLAKLRSFLPEGMFDSAIRKDLGLDKHR